MKGKEFPRLQGIAGGKLRLLESQAQKNRLVVARPPALTFIKPFEERIGKRRRASLKDELALGARDADQAGENQLGIGFQGAAQKLVLPAGTPPEIEDAIGAGAVVDEKVPDIVFADRVPVSARSSEPNPGLVVQPPPAAGCKFEAHAPFIKFAGDHERGRGDRATALHHVEPHFLAGQPCGANPDSERHRAVVERRPANGKLRQFQGTPDRIRVGADSENRRRIGKRRNRRRGISGLLNAVGEHHHRGYADPGHLAPRRFHRSDQVGGAPGELQFVRIPQPLQALAKAEEHHLVGLAQPFFETRADIGIQQPFAARLAIIAQHGHTARIVEEQQHELLAGFQTAGDQHRVEEQQQ